MDLLLTRFKASDKATIGTLAVDNEFFCYTLEDALRWPGQKIPDRTAIDPGDYPVIIDFSNRFQREMPHVMDVPNFEGIRIHQGNTDADTSGCILVGSDYSGDDFISNSVKTFDLLFVKLRNALATGGKITLHIVEQAEQPAAP